MVGIHSVKGKVANYQFEEKNKGQLFKGFDLVAIQEFLNIGIGLNSDF